jgi:hypothetical protein
VVADFVYVHESALRGGIHLFGGWRKYDIHASRGAKLEIVREGARIAAVIIGPIKLNRVDEDADYGAV